MWNKKYAQSKGQTNILWLFIGEDDRFFYNNLACPSIVRIFLTYLSNSSMFFMTWLFCYYDMTPLLFFTFKDYGIGPRSPATYKFVGKRTDTNACNAAAPLHPHGSPITLFEFILCTWYSTCTYSIFASPFWRWMKKDQEWTNQSVNQSCQKASRQLVHWPVNTGVNTDRNPGCWNYFFCFGPSKRIFSLTIFSLTFC